MKKRPRPYDITEPYADNTVFEDDDSELENTPRIFPSKSVENVKIIPDPYDITEPYADNIVFQEDDTDVENISRVFPSKRDIPVGKNETQNITDTLPATKLHRRKYTQPDQDEVSNVSVGIDNGNEAEEQSLRSPFADNQEGGKNTPLSGMKRLRRLRQGRVSGDSNEIPQSYPTDPSKYPNLKKSDIAVVQFNGVYYSCLVLGFDSFNRCVVTIGGKQRGIIPADVLGKSKNKLLGRIEQQDLHFYL